jgi:cytochrome c
MRKLLLVLMAFVLMGGIAYGDSKKGSADEAKALVEKGVAYLKANGKEKALAEFNNPKGKFVVKDLYLFVGDMEGNVLAHGAIRAFVGKNLMSLKDANGKYFVKEMVEMARKQRSGWVDYRWADPVTKKTAPKASYFETSEGMFIACGVYK